MRGDNVLDIGFEFRKGVLFIRLKGCLTKKTINKLDEEVTVLIRDNGIRNVVFNVSELDKIDFAGIKRLFYNYELCKNNRGVSLLCCINNNSILDKIKNTKLLKYMLETKDELSAFNFIN